jgi:hypothetical protein
MGPPCARPPTTKTAITRRNESILIGESDEWNMSGLNWMMEVDERVQFLVLGWCWVGVELKKTVTKRSRVTLYELILE